jgi:hypothetical protein
MYAVLCTDFYHFRNDVFSPIFTAFMSWSAWILGSSAAVDERSNEAATTYFKELGIINNQQ